MSAYTNQVLRLSTGPVVKMGAGSQQNLVEGQPRGSSQGRPPSERKQRKWRVLVSIGLLLPALAAIIGEFLVTTSGTVSLISQYKLANTNKFKVFLNSKIQALLRGL